MSLATLEEGVFLATLRLSFINHVNMGGEKLTSGESEQNKVRSARTLGSTL
jgi:hypothetical protein